MLNLHDQCDPRADLCNVEKDLICQPDTYKCLYATTFTNSDAVSQLSGANSTSIGQIAKDDTENGLSKAALTTITLLLGAVLSAVALSMVGVAYCRRKLRTAQQHAAAMVRDDNQTNEFINPAYNLQESPASSRIDVPASAITMNAAVNGTRRVAHIGATPSNSALNTSSAALRISADMPAVSGATFVLASDRPVPAAARNDDVGAGVGAGAGAGVVKIRSEEMSQQSLRKQEEADGKGSNHDPNTMFAARPPYENTAAHHPHNGVSGGIAAAAAAADDDDDDDGEDDDGEFTSTV